MRRVAPPGHSPGRLEIAKAVPAGSRRARDQRAWLRAALALIEAQRWYACRKESTAAVARQLALHMDWRTRTTRPGHDRIAARIPGRQPDGAGSTETVRRAIRWLEACGLLGLVSAGTCAAVRAHVLYAGSPNLAAVYVLSVPSKRAPLPRSVAGQDESVDLTKFRRNVVTAPRAREPGAGNPGPRSARAPRALLRVPHPAEAYPAWKTPKTRGEGLAAAAVVRDRGRLLARLSPRHWRHLARPFAAAGWCPADVLYALDHAPAGREHGYTEEVRHVAGWARHRLGLWLDSQGVPRSSPSQLRAAEHERSPGGAARAAPGPAGGC